MKIDKLNINFVLIGLYSAAMKLIWFDSNNLNINGFDDIIK